MLTRCLTFVGLIAALAILLNCGGAMLEKNRGKSFEAAKSNQILNPQASKNLDPVVGLDGQAAENTLQRYRDEFKAGPSKKTYNLNLGNIDSIGEK